MADNSELKAVIQGAQRLLEYASVKGIELPPELLRQVVGAQSLLSRPTVDPSTYADQETFWFALAKLSALTKPATTESVAHADAAVPDAWKTMWAKVTRSKANLPITISTSAMAVRWARFWALIGLVAVALCQLYYEVGQDATTKYVNALKVSRQEADRQGELERSLDRAQKATVTPEDAQRLRQEIANAGLTITEATEETRRRIHWLKKMLFWHDWPTVDEGSDDEAAQAQAVLSVIEGWLAILRGYALPIAWSFLGAALYVSRALADDIRSVAYVPERAILHRSRYYMGMVAGFIAAKFFSRGTGIDLGDITPFAVAFLVGYSVEVLFALLDRLIASFSTK